MSANYFISGIGTGVGKTIVSAILAQLWGADYWKPIQAGDLDQSDSDTVRNLALHVKNIHPEQFRLTLAASPHEAAEADQVTIRLQDFKLPHTDNNHLIVEGAGGLFVPINDQHFIIDLIERLKLPVILVIKDYLGCINHSILSIKALNAYKIPLAYVVFNGNFKAATRRIIHQHLAEGIKTIDIPELEPAEAAHIARAGEQVKQQLNNNSTQS